MRFSVLLVLLTTFSVVITAQDPVVPSVTIAYHDSGKIYLTDFQNEPSLLTDEATTNIFPTWSANGQQLAYLSDTSVSPTGQYHIVIMDLATRDVKQISSLELTSETNLAWSPDGKYIAVTLGALYVIDVETELTRQLSVDNISAHSPSWSPDSSRIAFSANSDVYVVYADGHDIRKLSTPRFSTYSHQPQWSFVNNEVLLLTSHDNSRSINIFNLDTDTVQEVLTTDRNDIWEPKWSPDGQKIAFTVLGDQTSGIPVIDSSDVYVMNADGTNLQAVSAKWTDQLIGWATDNQHVLYISIEPGSTTSSISIANVNDNLSIKISDERLDQVSIYPLAVTAQTSG